MSKLVVVIGGWSGVALALIVAGDPLPEPDDGGPVALVVDTTPAEWTVASQPLVPLAL